MDIARQLARILHGERAQEGDNAFGEPPSEATSRDSQQVAHSSTRAIYDDFALRVKLEQFIGLKEEIRNRTDIQIRILQMHITALTLVVGAILVSQAPLQIALFVPFAASFAGMWYFDHALAIERIGTYIATDIEGYLANAIVKRPGHFGYESNHMIDEVSWPPDRSWTFSTAIFATFALPIYLGLLGSIGIIAWSIYEFSNANGWEWLPELTALESEELINNLIPDTFDGDESPPTTLVDVISFVIVFVSFCFSLFCEHQFRVLRNFWRNECNSRWKRITQKIAYRFYATSCDELRQNNDSRTVSSAAEFISPSYVYHGSDVGYHGTLRDWHSHLERLGAGLSGFQVKFLDADYVALSASLEGRRIGSERQGLRALFLRHPFSGTIESARGASGTIESDRGAFSQNPVGIKGIHGRQAPWPGEEIALELSYAVGNNAPSPTIFSDRLRIVNGQVVEHWWTATTYPEIPDRPIDDESSRSSIRKTYEFLLQRWRV